MSNFIGEIVEDTRSQLGLTQDEYGSRYGVSGPAVFKFEKGYVRPSLDLWMKIALDAGLTEQRAVLLWAKTKLPGPYQDYVEMQSVARNPPPKPDKARSSWIKELSKAATRKDLLDCLKRSEFHGKGLAQLVEDDELWALYKPTGPEISHLIEVFGSLGNGTAELYREALCLLRSF